MRPLAPAVALALALSVLAVGCVQVPGSTVKPSTTAPDLATGRLAFTAKLIDSVRAGGEPVIQVTQKGTLLVSSHPGWTHTRYPPSANLVTPASGQSYMWRSTDNGTTWAPLGLPMVPGGVGPRGLGQGVSDPDFAMDSKGRIYFTDLEALVSASVSWSDDDGATWLQGNDIAASFGGEPIDRNWIATHGTDVYFMGNYFSGENVIKSSDGGITWSAVASSPCSQEFISDAAGDLLVGCSTGIAVLQKGATKFEERKVPGADTKSRGMGAPALDAAGNVYTTWANESGVWLAGSPDLGVTWWPPVNVAAPILAANATNIWPWVVAGDAGRVAVAWYGTNASGGPSGAKGDWFVFATTVLGADTTTPTLYPAQVTPTPIFQGGICQRGTACQADPSPAGDRRLGDFFEATVDPSGALLVVYSVALQDAISHPGFARQTAGPLLKN